MEKLKDNIHTKNTCMIKLDPLESNRGESIEALLEELGNTKLNNINLNRHYMFELIKKTIKEVSLKKSFEEVSKLCLLFKNIATYCPNEFNNASTMVFNITMKETFINNYMEIMKELMGIPLKYKNKTAIILSTLSQLMKSPVFKKEWFNPESEQYVMTRIEGCINKSSAYKKSPYILLNNIMELSKKTDFSISWFDYYQVVAEQIMLNYPNSYTEISIATKSLIKNKAFTFEWIKPGSSKYILGKVIRIVNLMKKSKTKPPKFQKFLEILEESKFAENPNYILSLIEEKLSPNQ